MARGSNSTKSSGGGKSTQNASSSKSSNSGGGRSTSNYSYKKDFGGNNNFMASYGLKPWKDADVQEGNAILDAFREADKRG